MAGSGTPREMLHLARRLGPVLGLVMIAVLLAACGGEEGDASEPTQPPSSEQAPAPDADPASTPTAEASEAEPATVRVGALGVSSDVALFLALDLGYFEDEQLSLDVQSFNSGTDMIAPLGTGDLDVGGGGISPALFNAIGRGIDLTIVADKGRHDPGNSFEALVVSQALIDQGYESSADLVGKTVAASGPAVSGVYVLDHILKEDGHELADVRVETLSFPDMMAAMGSGAIDAAMSVEPFVTLMEKNGLGQAVSRTGDLLPGTQPAVIIFSGSFATDQRDVGVRFLRAYVKAARYYNEALTEGGAKFEQVVDTMTTHTRTTDRDIYADMQLPALSLDGAVNTSSLEDQLVWYRDHDFIDGDVDLMDAIDMSIVEEAVAGLE